MELGLAIIVVLVANCQGASDFCNAESLVALQASLANLEGIEGARPVEGSFPIGGFSMRSDARHKPTFRLPKMFSRFPAGRVEAAQGPSAEASPTVEASRQGRLSQYF